MKRAGAPWRQACRLGGGNLGPRGGRLRGLLRERFTATLTNSADRPLPPGPRSFAAGKVQRLEVLRDTTPAALLRDIARRLPVRPSEVRRPVSRAGRRRVSGRPARPGLGALTGTDAHLRGTRCVSAAHRPVATADWTTYRLHATAGQLQQSAGVSVTVRAGSEHPTTLWIGRNAAHLTERGPERTRTGPSRRLEPATTHSVSLSVTPEAVGVVVDGSHRLTLPADWRGPAEGAGAFVLGTGVADGAGPDTSWPRFTALKAR
ncbi:hypothetical protein ACWGIV_06170 [Streptomyces sp. NPDC054844]